MKKLSLALAGLLAGVSLNAAVVATVNGKNISDTEVSEALINVLRGQSINALPANQKQAAIQEYIGHKLLLEEAKKQKLERDPLYAKELEKAKDSIIFSLYQKKMFDSIKVDEAKIRQIYEANKAQFVQPARVQARHILVEKESDAKAIINQLRNLKGDALTQKFAQLAAEKSIDQGSARSGGELGWFGESDMVKPFADTAFSLKNGEINKNPVKSQFGYHVILKENAQARTQLALEQVRAGIENQLKMQEVQQNVSQKAQELYGKAKIEIK